MKKVALFTLFSAFMFAAANGYCDAGTVTGSQANGPDAARHAHRAELIAQHKDNPKAFSGGAASAAGESKVSKFWKNEGERSGVSGWKAPAMHPIGWLKEQDRKYKERKAAK
jgi:hypothetical protein